ncbi:MAG TPA: asparagine synthase (glutamine-hydrolyzing) [Steroidobacteraceae bacterium]|jgi:asparagine synthase (glutamine-hydrolysing)|nr:asparagine synthase (glutamine-hydrolyzing) [Steroidobacteraceae bacterium]
MCGIAGFLGGSFPAERAREELAAMAAALRHRGPDDGGYWVDAAAAVALCHRRLAIIDLSPLGAQPMRSASGRFVITFNGEIYNYRALRSELVGRGVCFRGGSDTEVLLAAIEEWGLARALERSRGMFAFGLWDAAERVLWLARDRFGEKPLYYGEAGNAFLFGSELQALRAHSLWRGEIDRDALALLLRYACIPAPHSIFRGIRKLMPGCALAVRAQDGGFRLEEVRYFDPALLAPSDPAAGDEQELIEQVSAALAEAVRLQMVADVPVGAFLSGGIDSSLVVAEMQRASSQPVRTFSIGFEEQQFDETPYAREVATRLGTRHTELRVTPGDALEMIPRLPGIYDEPFADASQIPTALVSSLARREVTVSLSGDGGDEFFGGYSRYLEIADRWRRLRSPSGIWMRALARTVTRMPAGALAPLVPPLRVATRGRSRSAQRIKERAYSWTADSLAELYDVMTSCWQGADHPVIGATVPGRNGNTGRSAPRAGARAGADPIAQMMHADIGRYLPDDILVKVDRAAMAVSLETRVPLLDVEVARAAWRIPTAVHLRDGRGKWVLRRLLERHLPRELFERPKSGFAMPVARWLRGELREWAAAQLDPARLRREGYLFGPEIERRWRQHASGQADWSGHLWTVLMFQAWLEDFGCRDAAVRAAARAGSSRSRRMESVNLSAMR